MAQAASSSLPLRRTSRKLKPKVDPDFEYDYVQQCIDQLDRELAISGLSPRVSQVPSSPGRPSIPLRQMIESPATSQAADLTAQILSSELQLAQLQQDKLAPELEVLTLRTAAAETKFTDGADSSKSGPYPRIVVIDGLRDHLTSLAFAESTRKNMQSHLNFKHSDLRTSTPQPRSTISAGGGSPSGDTNTRSLKPDATQGKACRQWNYTGSCSCDTASSSYSGHHKCRVCAKDHPMLHCAK